MGGDVLNIVKRLPIFVAWATEAVELSIYNGDTRSGFCTIERPHPESMHGSAICADWQSMRVLTGLSDGMVSCLLVFATRP